MRGRFAWPRCPCQVPWQEGMQCKACGEQQGTLQLPHAILPRQRILVQARYGSQETGHSSLHG
eukprot:7045397-Pyramimonas_sp.AAC.1